MNGDPRSGWRIGLVLAAVLIAPGTARAHVITVTCRTDGGVVEVRVGFGRSASTPAAAASVRVLGPAGAVVAEGVTDAAGVWRTAAPPPGEYTVEATADDHAASVRLAVGPGAEVSTSAADGGPGRAWWPAAAVFGLVAAAVAAVSYRNRRAAARTPPTPSGPGVP
jgi:hypothetical protein